MGELNSTPNKFIRLDPYDTALKNQKALDVANAKKRKISDKRANDLTTLASVKQEEARQKAIKADAEKRYAPKFKDYQDARKYALTPESDGGTTPTPAEQNAVNFLGAAAAAVKTEVVAATTAYNNMYTARIALEKSLGIKSKDVQQKTLKDFVNGKKTDKIKSTGGAKTNTKNSSPAPKVPSPLIYYYNAPLISTAYFKSIGSEDGMTPQQYASKSAISDPGLQLNAMELWNGTNDGSKGIIQMDSTNVNTPSYSGAEDNPFYDPFLYGFKFLYNPKEVNMTWGVAEGMNWEGIQAGMDPYNAVTAALNNSTISFQLLLNRIQDMGYLNKNGLKNNTENPYPLFNARTGDPNDEFKEIYKKGTMYDLEYLFKAIGGLNNSFNSAFNDLTSDRGWLYGMAVELHLGNKMRYRVRITSLEVTHSMFDDRMVPTLSSVNITCARYPNIPNLGGTGSP